MSEAENQVDTLPVVPLKGKVFFPHIRMPLSVGRPPSVAAVEAAVSTEAKEMVVFAQRDSSVEVPGQDDLYTIGTKAIIKKILRPREDFMELIAQGMERVVLIKMEKTEPFLEARVRRLPLPEDKGTEVEALHLAVLDLAGKAIALFGHQAKLEILPLLSTTEDSLQFVYLAASILSLEIQKEQDLLEAQTVADALRLLHTYLNHEIQVLELRKKIASHAVSEMSNEQREYFLRQQLRAIQQELGEQDPEHAELDLLHERLEKADLPDDVYKETERELARLERLPSASPEHGLIRSYLDLVLELPWKKTPEKLLDIPRARRVLEKDHYDLKEVKERILEHLGVLKLNPGAKSPILCFIGPPGTGKTSLGQSIARALKRKFERMSLGGMHDEAELRGHRRTYIGAMPGRIIQAIRRAEVNNPVLMLDEVDKLGRDFRGDPAAALMEILDPEQNSNFRDNYLNLPFDLSSVFFITTANTLESIPRPLLDRMEKLRLPGYSEEEKLEIAKRYLVPRQIGEAGLKTEQCALKEDTLKQIISCYTREAGVRQLERAIARVFRKIALKFAEGETAAIKIATKDLLELLGPGQFFLEQAREELPPGVSTGVAWTETGGDVLYVEATLLPGGKDLTLTGQLGEVMQESAKAAQSYIWSHAGEMGIDPELFTNSGLHVHVPAGAIPKDGPSAGITIAAALASLYTNIATRKDTAMTGEITLTGLVLPVGGIKEKVLAARRAEIKRMILPRENRKDLREIPDQVRDEMEFVFVERIEEVLLSVISELEVVHATGTGP